MRRRMLIVVSSARSPQPSVAIFGFIAATISCISAIHGPFSIACWPTGYYSAALIIILICIYPMHQARTIRTPRFPASADIHGRCEVIRTDKGRTPHARAEA